MISYLKVFLVVVYSFILSIIALIFIFIDRSFTLYYWLSKVYSGGVLLITGIKVKTTGLENFDHSKVYVYVSNHSSLFDITALQWTFPNRASMVFKKELGKIPFFGWQLALGPYVMIDRANPEKAMKSIERAKRIMKNKRYSILLFAEGTRSKTGEVQPFKRGAFYLASRVGYPIVPISISGTSKILPKGKFKIKSGTITVHFDKPITTENIKTKVDEVNLMENVREIIIRNIIK